MRFFHRALKPHERRHSPVEKEACVIVKACRKWRHYLTGRHFLLITDQQAVSYMFDTNKHGKIKNNEILRWRVELSCLIFDKKYRPGSENVTADCLTRAFCSALSQTKSLKQLQWISKFSDKISSLTNDPTFPLSTTAVQAFNGLKRDIMNSCISCPNKHDLLVVETDASDSALSASLNQGGKPIAFFSRTL